MTDWHDDAGRAYTQQETVSSASDPWTLDGGPCTFGARKVQGFRVWACCSKALGFGRLLQEFSRSKGLLLMSSL